MSKETDRHSRPVQTVEHQPLTDEQRAPIETENAFRQFDRLMVMVEDNLERQRQGRQGESAVPVKTSVLIELNRLAVERIIANPGAYRQTPMEIGKSKHEPPRWEDVPELVDEMCEYVARNWHRSAIHLAAYLLWRVNWIHPFSDGNGRTARAISYLVLCVRLRQRLPGEGTIPDFIADEKTPYYAGLEAADNANARGRIDVSVLERYLKKLLSQQVEQAASAAMPMATPPPTPVQLKRDGDAISEALGVDEAASATRKAAWIGGAALVFSALVAAVVGLGRCGKDARCVVGLQQSCPCTGGITGTQVCVDNGLKFSDCNCVVSRTDAGIDTVTPADALIPVDTPAVTDAQAAPVDTGATQD